MLRLLYLYNQCTKLRLTPRNPLKGVAKGARERIAGTWKGAKEKIGIGARKQERIRLADSAVAGAESKYQAAARAKQAADRAVGDRRRGATDAKAALDSSENAAMRVFADHTSSLASRLATRDTRPERFLRIFKIPKKLPSSGELFAAKAKQHRLQEEANQKKFDAAIARAEARVDEAPDAEIDVARQRLQAAREAKANYTPVGRRSAAELPSVWQPLLSFLGAGSSKELTHADSATLAARQRIADANQAIAQAQLDRAEAAFRAAQAERGRMYIDETAAKSARDTALSGRNRLNESRFPGLRSRGDSLQDELQKLRSDFGVAEGPLAKAMVTLKWYGERSAVTKVAVGALLGASIAGVATAALPAIMVAGITAAARGSLSVAYGKKLSSGIEGLMDKARLSQNKILRTAVQMMGGATVGAGATFALHWILGGFANAASSTAERASTIGDSKTAQVVSAGSPPASPVPPVEPAPSIPSAVVQPPDSPPPPPASPEGLPKPQANLAAYDVAGEATGRLGDGKPHVGPRTGPAWEELGRETEALESRRLRDWATESSREAEATARVQEDARLRQALRDYDVTQQQAAAERSAIEGYERNQAATAVEREATVKAYALEDQRLAQQTAEAFRNQGVHGAFRTMMEDPNSPITLAASETGINLESNNKEGIGEALNRTLARNPKFMSYFDTSDPDHAASIRAGGGKFISNVDINPNDPKSGNIVRGMFKNLYSDKTFMAEFEKTLQSGTYDTLRSNLGGSAKISALIRALQQ